MKFRIFVSSVQSEFAKERKALAAYIREDALLADFFDVFLFEEQPARSRTAQSVFLGEVEKCDVYLGLFGGKYAGGKGTAAVSPTEQEYDLAKKLGKTLLGFVKTGIRREKREDAFIREKVDADLSRNPFANFDELKVAVYKSLVALLKEQDEISNRPFDQSFSHHVKMSDLDEGKFRDYVKMVREAKKTSFAKNITDEEVLVWIKAMDAKSGKIANAAIPLFARHPEDFAPSWEVRCVQYYGTTVAKPIPSLHTYTGTVFELVDQALDFIMGRVDFEIGRLNGPTAAAPTHAELPRDAVREALVNAVCHRDYTSSGAVQVTLFRDRLEIINPGSLPKGWTAKKLYEGHDSVPRNQIIARAMSWTSYVEKSGHGTGFIVGECEKWALARPSFEPDYADFRTVIWRKGYGPGLDKDSVGIQSGPSRDPVGTQSGPSQQRTSREDLTIQERTILCCQTPQSVSSLLETVGRTNRTKFKQQVLRQLMSDGVLEWTIPEKPNSRLQKYRLTPKGRRMVVKLNDGHKG